MRALDRADVSAWLASFDEAAIAIPEPRRGALLNELRGHLEEAIPADASDADVEAVLAELGDPSTIVDGEVDAASRVEVEPRPQIQRRTLAIGAAVIIVVAVLLAVVLPAVIGATRFAGP